ncbi:sigma-54-dependent Fis family transcriptional regulator [Tindallia californiensis]|uniref:PAS domain S-box-containing protein n=1 Tax=Tindallia californiensis TaxID=159292 RepID=A0A1H3J0C5_9FIRM|nr:sigma 54-interacting transcriptional regulator [Tindallia californiensis]SDY33410.1 PAS domain S-box-containing protein [Tindallia californiensis]
MDYQSIASENDMARKAWESCLIHGVPPHELLRNDIADSWNRSMSFSVDPYNGTCKDVFCRQKLSFLLQEKKNLIDIARPIMKTLYKSVQGNSFVVVLSNEGGRILEMIGDDEVLRSATSMNFMVGADWSEASVGTNAIGTCLALDKPVQVAGAEHFCLKHHLWFCSAAPIHAYSGKMIGCLNLSCSVERDYKRDQGMVVAAVRAIENQLHKGETQEKLLEAHKHLTAVMSSISEGIMSVSQSGEITHVNAAFTRMFETHASTLIGSQIQDVLKSKHHIQEVLETGQRCLEEELQIEKDQKQIHCTYSATPILSRSGKVRGAVLVFREMKQVHHMINKIAGSQARYRFTDIIGNSIKIKKVIQKGKSVSQSPSTVLILGESGTGKEMIAQAIHNASDRRDAPFVALNCAAMPRELIQSELFGYREGAFTGASKGGRPGKFELADGGTLFLDEIGDMPLDMQVNLLRVLQENSVLRIGGEYAVPVDVRLIAATNKNLQQEVEKGEFRQDLFYRLNVVTVTIPPLRERGEDLHQLVDYFCDKIALKLGKQVHRIEEQLYQKLKSYQWPGNVRELENVLEYAINMLEGTVLTVELLPAYLEKGPHQRYWEKEGELIQSLQEIEAEAIIKSIHRHNGKITAVAKELGIARNTLYEKMKKYHINKPT